MELTEKKTGRVMILASAVCNLLVVGLTLYSVLRFFSAGGEGNMTVKGNECFRFFTVDSNILAAVVSLALLISELLRLKSGEALPAWIVCLKGVGAAAVGVTFFTVVLFLGPRSGYGAMFAGPNLYLHLITPLLSMLSFVLLERSPFLRLRTAFFGILPTLIYGIVYFWQVILVGPMKGGWYDFYGFNLGGMWYVSAPLMVAATWLLSLFLWALRKAGKKKK